MAGFFGRFIIKWECLKPEQYHEVQGETEWVASSINQAKEQFLEKNPDYKIVSVKEKRVEMCQYGPCKFMIEGKCTKDDEIAKMPSEELVKELTTNICLLRR